MFTYEIKTDAWSSVVEMKVSDENNRIAETRTVFDNPVKADVFVRSQLTAYLQRRLRNYIWHARRIHMASAFQYYRTPLFRKSLHICILFERTLNDQNLFSIAHFVRANAENLTNILPLESNTSYYSSSQTLKELLYLSRFLQRQTQRTF